MRIRAKATWLASFIFVVLAFQNCGDVTYVPPSSRGTASAPSLDVNACKDNAPWPAIKQVGIPSATIHGTAIARDNAGNIYVGGNTNANHDAGQLAVAGTYDVFVSKYNSAGVLQWTRQYGVPAYQSGLIGVAVDGAGNVYIEGSTQGNLVTGSGGSTGTYDVYIMKLDGAGTRQWVRQRGLVGFSTLAAGFVVDPVGNVYLSGTTRGNLVTGAGAATGNHDVFLMKYSSDGAHVWTKQVGAPGLDTFGYGATADADANIYLSGNTNANLEAGTGPSTGSYDMFVLKLDSSGNRLWLKQVGVAGFETNGRGLAADASGNVFVVATTTANLMAMMGASTGAYDTALGKFDSSGALLWRKQWGQATKQNYGNDVAVDLSGNAYVSIGTDGNLMAGSGSSSGSFDAAIVKVSSSGTELAVKQYGLAAKNTYIAKLVSSVSSGCAGPISSVYAVGSTTGDLFTGSGGAIGVRDAIVIKVD